jgi:hypothetical protein
MEEVNKHVIVVSSQNFPILNLVIPMNIQVVEGVYEDLKFLFQVTSFCPFHLPCISERIHLLIRVKNHFELRGPL